jgi:hypothetical protein
MRPVRRPVDPRALLGVGPGATRAEIRRAYRRRALEVHPDIAGSDTTAQMAALNAARDRLLGEAAERGAGDGQAVSASATPPRASGASVPPAYDHSPTWDDYWAAWNDPPRRER